jgi:hypothetical protein
VFRGIRRAGGGDDLTCTAGEQRARAEQWTEQLEWASGEGEGAGPLSSRHGPRGLELDSGSWRLDPGFLLGGADGALTVTLLESRVQLLFYNQLVGP